MEYKREIITINNASIEIIIDDQGIKWYPLSEFFKKVLKKNESASSFAKTELSKNMKQFTFNASNPLMPYRWYINEAALVLILKNIRVDGYSEKTIEREMALARAKEYFGIKIKTNAKNMYGMIKPQKKDYSEWEMICFEFDTDVMAHIVWKMCDTCGRYFPNSKHYFKTRGYYYQLENTCLECCGQEFESMNRDVQAFKITNRLELIKYLRKDDPIGLYQEMKKKHFPYELLYFNNRTRLLMLVDFLNSERKVNNDNSGFYLRSIGIVLNMTTNKLKNIIGDYEIGINHPLPIHKEKTGFNELTEEEKRKRILVEHTAEEKKKIKRKRDSQIYLRRQLEKRDMERQQEINDLIDWCKTEFPINIPSDYLRDAFPSVEYAFITPKALHVIVHDKYEHPQKIKVHRLPRGVDVNKSMRKKLEVVKNEYDS